MSNFQTGLNLHVCYRTDDNLSNNLQVLSTPKRKQLYCFYIDVYIKVFFFYYYSWPPKGIYYSLLIFYAFVCDLSTLKSFFALTRWIGFSTQVDMTYMRVKNHTFWRKNSFTKKIDILNTRQVNVNTCHPH